MSYIPVMFIAGMVVQFCKTGEGSDHKQGIKSTDRKKMSFKKMSIANR